MGSFSKPTTAAAAIKLGQGNVEGMEAQGTSLPVTYITTQQCKDNLADFIAKNNTYNAGRSTLQTASTANQNALAPIYPWLLGVSNTLATRFGTRWNTQWAQAGFSNYTTGIPDKIEDQLALCLSLVAYFEANPTAELPSLNQTAAYGKQLRDNYVATLTPLANAKIAFDVAGNAWNTSFSTLVGGMQQLYNNLTVLLNGDDMRWVAFGFKIPNAIVTPGQPQNVVVNLDETGAVIVQCDPVPLATRYRVRTLIVGQQTSYVLSVSGPAPMLALKQFLPGQTIQIIIQAVNGSLQGVASEPVQFTLPVAKRTSVAAADAAQAVSEVPALGTSASTSVSNGSNGHANGSRLPALK